MAVYTLNVKFDEQDLNSIVGAGEQIVIAKVPAQGNSQLAWVATRPFLNNQFQWTVDYALYGRWIQGGQEVNIVSMASTDMPTPSGQAYELTSSGEFRITAQDEFPPQGTYRVFNSFEPGASSNLTFGLLEPISANGTTNTSRTSEQFVPFNQLADFTPNETVVLWLQSNVETGDLVEIPPAVGVELSSAAAASVKSRSTTIHFGGGLVEATYEYDSSVGGFVPSRTD